MSAPLSIHGSILPYDATQMRGILQVYPFPFLSCLYPISAFLSAVLALNRARCCVLDLFCSWKTNSLPSSLKTCRVSCHSLCNLPMVSESKLHKVCIPEDPRKNCLSDRFQSTLIVEPSCCSQQSAFASLSKDPFHPPRLVLFPSLYASKVVNIS